MTQPDHREKHLNYVGLRANRDVVRVFMWLKIGIGAVGFIALFGYSYFNYQSMGSAAGGYVYLSFIPLIILALGLWDLFTISLSKLVESRMRKNDRHGRSNRWHLIVVTIGGFVFLHVLMLKFLGSGYLPRVLSPGPDGYNATALFMVFMPYVGFAGLMLYYWLTPEAEATDLPEEEEIALAEEKRRKQRAAIFGIYTFAIIAGVGIVYFFAV